MKSYTKIPNEILNSNQLSVPERYLYCVLLRYCGNKDYCYPSQNTLGNALGYSERHIRGLLRVLEVAGFISRSRRGFNRPNTYRVTDALVSKGKPSSVPSEKPSSPHLGSAYPLHQGTEVPPNTTYIKGKDKTISEGMKHLREVLDEIKSRGPIKRAINSNTPEIGTENSNKENEEKQIISPTGE